MSTQIGEVNINLRMSLAQFRTDVKDAATANGEAAKQLASDMGNAASEAKGSLMLINHELGLQMPRHLTALIAEIPGLQSAFAAMLPVVGVITAIAVIEKLYAAHEKAKEAMLAAMDEIGAKDATVLDGLTEKLDASKLKFMELTDDGVGAAQLKLDMMAHTTLVSLVGAFDNLGKSIEDVLKKMGSEGTFARIMGLAGASDSIRNLQKDVLSIRANNDTDEQKAAEIGKKIEWYRDKAKGDLANMQADRDKLANSSDEDMLSGHGGGGNFTDKQFTEQQALYTSLNDMARASGIIQQTQAQDTTNIEIEEANKAAKEEEKQWLARNTEYQRSLKSDEAAETAAYKEAVSGIQEGEKLKIDATRQGSQARLDAVVAAIKDEEAHGLQDTAFYKSLQEEQVKIAQEMANQRMQIERKLSQEIGKTQQSMISLSNAAAKQQADYEFKLGVTTADEHIQTLRDAAAQELALEQQKNEAVLNEMEKSDPLYPVALQKRLDADLQAQQKYNNEMAALDHAAMDQRKAEWDAGFNQINSGLTTMVGNMVKGNASITADLKTMLQNMLSAWINYFVQWEAKALSAKLFVDATGLFGGSSFVPGVPGMSASALPSGGALPGGLPSSIFHADGGHMDAGEVGIVGDAGPEVWRPDSSGEVIPLSKMAKGDTHNHVTNVHIHGVSDVDSFKQNQSQIAAQLYASMAAAARRKG